MTDRDDCAICHGLCGGTPGNENIVEGLIMCDYCSVSTRPLTDEIARLRAENAELRAAMRSAMPLLKLGYSQEWRRYEDMHRPDDHSIEAYIGHERIDKIMNDVRAALGK